MIRILFDGPPSRESGRFIEVENEKGESISLGEWVQDGEYWVLQFPDNREVNADLLEALEGIRDLARTGTAPMAFNMTPRDWDAHKINSIAREAQQAIEKAKS